MTLQEMREAAKRAMEEGRGFVMLPVKRPEGSKPYIHMGCETVRLFGQAGPRGTIYADCGATLRAAFNPVEVIAWLGKP